MAIQFQCSRCGRQFNVPSSASGKMGKCSTCGNLQPVPAPSQAGIAVRPAASTSPPQNPAGSLSTGAGNQHSIDSDAIEKAILSAFSGCQPFRVRLESKSVPRDPWYYTALEASGILTLIAGILVGMWILMLCLLYINGSMELDVSYAWALSGMALGLVIASAAQLIVVDVARNIRALRYRC